MPYEIHLVLRNLNIEIVLSSTVSPLQSLPPNRSFPREWLLNFFFYDFSKKYTLCLDMLQHVEFQCFQKYAIIRT